MIFQQVKGARTMGINLVVHAGASAIGLNFPDGIEITIGREIGNTIAPVEAEGLSRRHAKIVQTDGAWRIEDLGSTNGTFVGKEKISGPREIKIGDRVSCGKFTFAVEPVQAESEAAVSSAPPPVEKPVMPKPAAVLTPSRFRTSQAPRPPSLHLRSRLPHHPRLPQPHGRPSRFCVQGSSSRRTG